MRKGLACALLALGLLLGGCWDRTEVEDTAFVVTLGVDAAGQREWLWTFRVATTTPTGARGQIGQSGQGGKSQGVVTVRAPSLIAAVQVAQAGYGRILSLHQLRAVLFGEELARQGLDPVVSQIIRNNEVRTNMSASVTRGPASAVMRAFRPQLDANPVKLMEGLVLVQKRMHLSPPVRFQHFYSQHSSAGEDPIMSLAAINQTAAEPWQGTLPPMGERSLMAGDFPRSGANPVELAGTAVFHQDRLVGFLNVNETMALLALRGQMGKVYATVPNPKVAGSWISIRFGQENKPQVRASWVNGRPVVTVKLQLEGEVLSAPGETGFTYADNRRDLEQFVASYWQNELIAPMLRRVYQEWGADPVGFGNRYRKRFPTYRDWLAYRWLDRVKTLQATVDVDMYIRRFGLLLDVQKGGGK